MKKSVFRIAIPLTALVAAVGLAAGVSAKPGHGHRGHRLEKKIERLDLAPETESAAFAIIDAARPAQREVRDRLRDAREDLRALLEADTSDEAAIMDQVDTVGALSTEARKQSLRTMLEVRALLSPEERTQLSEMKRKHHRRERRSAE